MDFWAKNEGGLRKKVKKTKKKLQNDKEKRKKRTKEQKIEKNDAKKRAKLYARSKNVFGVKMGGQRQSS